MCWVCVGVVGGMVYLSGALSFAYCVLVRHVIILYIPHHYDYHCGISTYIITIHVTTITSPHVLHHHMCSITTCAQGKVRDTYVLGDKIIIVTTDRQSAFDRILAAVPYKVSVVWWWWVLMMCIGGVY